MFRGILTTFLCTAIMSHSNPFSVEDDSTIFNLMTLTCVPEQMCHKSWTLMPLGRRCMNTVKEHINGSVGIWAPVKKRKSHLHLKILTYCMWSVAMTSLWHQEHCSQQVVTHCLVCPLEV